MKLFKLRPGTDANGKIVDGIMHYDNGQQMHVVYTQENYQIYLRHRKIFETVGHENFEKIRPLLEEIEHFAIADFDNNY
jgi:hypothetical protein